MCERARRRRRGLDWKAKKQKKNKELYDLRQRRRSHEIGLFFPFFAEKTSSILALAWPFNGLTMAHVCETEKRTHRRTPVVVCALFHLFDVVGASSRTQLSCKIDCLPKAGTPLLPGLQHKKMWHERMSAVGGGGRGRPFCTYTL